jgi:hypothetical protein
MLNYNQVKQDAMLMEVDLQWAIDARKRYLNSEIGSHANEINSLILSLAGKNSLTRELALRWVKEHDGEMKILQREISFLKPSSNVSKNEITNAMIQKARKYPIKDLLPNPIKRNMTDCIAHNDKNPSMRIKDNRAKCFSCGFKGDVIEVYMRLNSVGFKTAVRNLN